VRLLPFFLFLPLAHAQLVPDAMIRTIFSEFSAGNAWHQTSELASRSRYPNSAGFFEAAEYVAAEARAAGLRNVRIERFETKSPSWDPVEGDLELLAPERRVLSNLRDTSVLVAQGSANGDITAELVDVGEGTAAADYQGKDVKGKILLAGGDPLSAWSAMDSRGAAGILSYASSRFFGRRTPPDAVAWGRGPDSAPAMMISPSQGQDLRGMIRAGRAVRVRMHVRVKTSSPGAIGMVMGELTGEVKDQDIVLVAHLDHQKPGANDNASGSGTLLEVLATLERLVASGRMPAPRRTLRFWWSTEIQSERQYFRKHPEEARKILLAVNLDQAGGERGAENNFIMIGGPDWLPSYADDLIYNLAEDVKSRYAPAEHEPDALTVAPDGSRQSLRTVYWEYAELSDHISFEARQVGIPSISLAVPSLDLIHTSLDSSDRIDPTWLKRCGAIMLASALFAASAGPPEARALLDFVFHRSAARLAQGGQLAIEEKRLDSIRKLDPSVETQSYKKKLSAIAGALR